MCFYVADDTNLASAATTTAPPARFVNNLLTNVGGNAAVNNAVNNQLPFGTSSDSESPTEPVSQQTVQIVAMLRARVVPNKSS